MSANLGLATGELQQMQVAGGGESLWKEAFKRLRRHLSGQALPALALPH